MEQEDQDSVLPVRDEYWIQYMEDHLIQIREVIRINGESLAEDR